MDTRLPVHDPDDNDNDPPTMAAHLARMTAEQFTERFKAFFREQYGVVFVDATPEPGVAKEGKEGEKEGEKEEEGDGRRAPRLAHWMARHSKPRGWNAQSTRQQIHLLWTAAYFLRWWDARGQRIVANLTTEDERVARVARAFNAASTLYYLNQERGSIGGEDAFLRWAELPGFYRQTLTRNARVWLRDWQEELGHTTAYRME